MCGYLSKVTLSVCLIIKIIQCAIIHCHIEHKCADHLSAIKFQVNILCVVSVLKQPCALGCTTSVTVCIGPDCTAFLLEHSVLCRHLSTCVISILYSTLIILRHWFA